MPAALVLFGMYALVFVFMLFVDVMTIMCCCMCIKEVTEEENAPPPKDADETPVQALQK